MDQQQIAEIDRPPVGTPCSPCARGEHGMGHFCPAVCYVDQTSDAAVCRSCMEQKDCPHITARRRLQANFDEPDLVEPDLVEPEPRPLLDWPTPELLEPLEFIAPVPPEEPEPAEEMIVHEETPAALQEFVAEQAPPSRKFQLRIPDEIRQQILAEPVEMSNRQLETKYKFSSSIIGKIRRKAGIMTEGMRQTEDAKLRRMREREVAPQGSALLTEMQTLETVARQAGSGDPKVAEAYELVIRDLQDQIMRLSGIVDLLRRGR